MKKERAYHLFSREEKVYKGKKVFFERWIEPKSKSGIIFYSDVKPVEGKYYVVEGYGISTVNPKGFSVAPGTTALIQRRTYKHERGAREGLRSLMNYYLLVSKDGTDPFDELEHRRAGDEMILGIAPYPKNNDHSDKKQ